jgi:UDP-galactopyranose mutase
MGGFEGADHMNSRGQALDMVSTTGHLDQLEADYERAACLGLKTVRESIGWRLAEPRRGCYDFGRATRMADIARRQGLQICWTFMHYGTPEDVNLLQDDIIDRFPRYAAAAAEALAPWVTEPPIYNLVNEIGFLAWAVSATNLIHPYRGESGIRGVQTVESGYAVKRRLVRAVVAATAAVRDVDPRARFIHIEPLVHAVAPDDRPDLSALAERICAYQWQAWDMLSGRVDQELGGSHDVLDLIGANYYHSGQWEVGTERRLDWHARDRRRKPLSSQLREVWTRYGRPLMVAETSHVGRGRADWLNDVASEVQIALNADVPLQGVCLYPLIDRADWDDPSHWHHSGLWDANDRLADNTEAASTRILKMDYAAVLQRWQQCLPQLTTPGAHMPHLIVFSHLRWGFVYQRPQHLLSRLSRTFNVVYVEEPVRGEGEPRLQKVVHGPGLDVLVPHTPIDAPGFHDDQLSLLRPMLANYLLEHGIKDYLVWFYTPMALPLISEMQPRAVIYDCMDELSAFKHAPRQLRQRETALLKVAQIVFTGGPTLFDAKRGLHANVHCLPSSVDADHFSPARLRADDEEAFEATRLQGALPRPRLGFFGVIDERFDLTLLAYLADARPAWQFVMAGPVVKIDQQSLPKRANIHWLGIQPYSRLPYLMAGWDVCLMPFALNESTRFISPTKTLEYLAGEKPVVSTPVHDVVALYGDVVHIAAQPAEFLAACEIALAERGHQHGDRASETLRTVLMSSWDRTADTVQRLIDEVLAKTPLPSPASRELAVAVSVGTTMPPAAAPLAPLATSANRAGRRVRHLVIGAGPTGLAAAYELGRQAPLDDTLVIEREAQIGGWCRSVEQDGFTFDHAGHIMFSNDDYVLGLYKLLLGANLHWQNREAWIYSHGTYTRYPFQGSLYGLPSKVLKECLVGAIEARFGPLEGGTSFERDHAGPPRNFEEFIHRVWGDGIAKHFATPYNRKLWAVPLAEMETSWLGGRVPLPDLAQMIDGALEPSPAPMGPNAHFGYPLKGGFQALMDGFKPLLDCEISLKTAVLQISPSQRTVRLDDGRLIAFDAMISTMPLPSFVDACGDEAPPDVRAAAAALRHVSVRCVNLGVAVAPGRDRLTEKHWIYYPEESVFHRIFVQGNASPHCSPSGHCGITCEITYSVDKPLPCDGAALIERVIDDCLRVGIISERDQVVSAGQVDMPCAYVVYDHARASNVACVRDWLSRFDIVLAGRYAEWAYYNSDHAFVAGRDAAARVLSRLGRSPVARAG